MFSFHLFSKRIRPCNPVPFHIAEVWPRRHRGATWLCPKGRWSLDELDRPRVAFQKPIDPQHITVLMMSRSI